MKYTGKDIISVIAKDKGKYCDDGIYYIILKDGGACILPYDEIEDEDFEFLNATGDPVKTEKCYKDKCLDIFAKYVNQCVPYYRADSHKNDIEEER